jgi:glutaminyl-peptide cyclotransferase
VAGPLALAFMMIRGFTSAQPPPRANLPVDRYTVVKTYPHDPDAFTQGLQYLDGFLYEGTGLNGRSSIRQVALETGKVLKRHDMAGRLFGEGITIWKSHLFQLTWQSGMAFQYDLATFTPQRTFTYRGEGWGLTHDATRLIMSDGSEFLRFIDPVTFAETSRVRVTAAGTPVRELNELEFVKGEIFANIWQTDRIARIDPKTGDVTGWIDLTGLLSPRVRASTDVLNGIAYDDVRDRLFVTGKLWPKLFQIKILKS